MISEEAISTSTESETSEDSEAEVAEGENEEESHSNGMTHVTWKTLYLLSIHHVHMTKASFVSISQQLHVARSFKN